MPKPPVPPKLVPFASKVPLSGQLTFDAAYIADRSMRAFIEGLFARIKENAHPSMGRFIEYLRTLSAEQLRQNLDERNRKREPSIS
jgi:hypothetical protein